MQTDFGPTETPASSRRGRPVDLDAFAQVVRASRERAREVVTRLSGAALADTLEPLRSVTDEWLATIEQLQVAEEELRQQNETLAETSTEAARQSARYQDLFELAPDAYIVTDAYGAVRESNRAASALLRLPRGYLAGKPLAVFLDGDARRALRESVTRLAAEGNIEPFEVQLRPRYGPSVYASVIAAASRDADGKITSIRWVLRDVTEEHWAAKRARAVAMSVEHRVGQRTARLERAILERDARIAVLEAELAAEREARLRADATSARRFDLLGILSHEIRTPLHASQGYLELLQTTSETLTPEQRGWLTRMHRVQDYLVRILEGMLALSRLERGSTELDVANVPVDEMLATIMPLVQPHVIEKGLRYEHVGGDASVRVRADPERLQQILLNLVTNAVKFTPPGGRISVTWEAYDDMVSIRVSDTGVGVAPHDAERIFEPFVQGAGGGGAVHGVGLGLAISRQLARLMGGDITVASAPGEGATFTLTVPRSPDTGVGSGRGDA
jgi:PAS domain S-box-containing protein